MTTERFATELARLDALLLGAPDTLLERFPASDAGRHRRLLLWYELLARADERMSDGRADPEGAVDGPRSAFTAGVEGALAIDMGDDHAALRELSFGMAGLGQLLESPARGGRFQERLNGVARLRQELGSIAQGLGLLGGAPAATLAAERASLLAEQGLSESLIEQRISERAEARAARDWARADGIAASLREQGVVLMDRGGRTEWKLVLSES